MTKSDYLIEFMIPEALKSRYHYYPGQYSTFKHAGVSKDFSYASSPLEEQLSFGIKQGDEKSFAYQLIHHIEVGNYIEISEPRGRFTIPSKPNEKRVILGFAAGIGITPILSHLKYVLQTEPFARFFLFYGNKSRADVAFAHELQQLQHQYSGRLQVFYFYSREKIGNPLFEGRLDAKKLKLIINQFLGQDEEDDENTIWDATDEVLVCGPGAMIKSIANACYENGIRKKNIHFELFQEFNEDIYKVEKPIPEVVDIQVNLRLRGENYQYHLTDNKGRLLSALLEEGLSLPYSCKSGICGTCRCQLTQGEVLMIEDDYLTEKEKQAGLILPCVSVALSPEVSLNFDEF